MSRYNYVGLKPLEENVTLNADYTFEKVDVRHLINCSFNLIAGAGITGVVRVQWSNDGNTFYNLLDSNGSDVELSLSGTADNLQFDLSNFSYGWFRLFYDHTSGSGTADLIYTGKSQG